MATSSCFSFHPLKLVSTGDGGMLTTQNPEWDAQFRLLRQHAMSVPTTVRYGSTQVIFESYPTVGFNYRMTDIQAAVGREQLKRLPGSSRERRALAARYADLLADIPGLVYPRRSRRGRARNWQSYCVRLPEAASISVRHAGDARRRHQHAPRHHVQPPEPAYGDASRYMRLPMSERAQQRTVLLPLFPGMTVDEQATVVGGLRQAARLLPATRWLHRLDQRRTVASSAPPRDGNGMNSEALHALRLRIHRGRSKPDREVEADRRSRATGRSSSRPLSSEGRRY